MNNTEKTEIERRGVEESFTTKCKTPCGTLYVTCSHREFDPLIEIFVGTRSLTPDRQFECGWSLNAIAVGCSFMLQYGMPPEKVAKYSNNFKCPRWSEYGIETCPEYINKILSNPRGICENAENKKTDTGQL